MTVPTQSPAKNDVCAMCGRFFSEDRTRTKEHIMPAWMVGKKSDLKYFGYDEQKEALVRRNQSEFTLNRVCQKCNNGWMAEVEGKMKSIVESDLSRISVEAQEVMYRWISKIAVLIRSAENRERWSQGKIDLVQRPYWSRAKVFIARNDFAEGWGSLVWRSIGNEIAVIYNHSGFSLMFVTVGMRFNALNWMAEMPTRGEDVELAELLLYPMMEKGASPHSVGAVMLDVITDVDSRGTKRYFGVKIGSVDEPILSAPAYGAAAGALDSYIKSDKKSVILILSDKDVQRFPISGHLFSVTGKGGSKSFVYTKTFLCGDSSLEKKDEGCNVLPSHLMSLRVQSILLT